MNPLSKIFYKKTLSGDEKLGIFALIVIILFDFLLFPLPILAAGADIPVAEHTSSTTKEYLVSQETIDNHSFFLLIPNANDDNTLILEPSDTPENNISAPATEKIKVKTETKNTNSNHLPKNQAKKTVSTGTSVITAYNSEVSQCDGDPCTTANGFNVCKHGVEDTVAANHLAFGTKIKIPALFGDRIFVVRDRMNSRFTGYIDVWMKNKKDALQLGVRTAKVEIVE